VGDVQVERSACYMQGTTDAVNPILSGNAGAERAEREGERETGRERGGFTSKELKMGSTGAVSPTKSVRIHDLSSTCNLGKKKKSSNCTRCPLAYT
jgi:hypothetical protein